MANGTALTAAAVALFVAGVLLGFSALASLARARLLRFLFRSLLSVLFVASGVGLGMIVLGLLWYVVDAWILAPIERATGERWGLVQR